MRWDRRPKRCESLGKPKTLRRSLPGAGRAGCAWTEQSGLAEGEKWRLKRPLRAAVQGTRKGTCKEVYFSLGPTLLRLEANVFVYRTVKRHTDSRPSSRQHVAQKSETHISICTKRQNGSTSHHSLSCLQRWGRESRLSPSRALESNPRSARRYLACAPLSKPCARFLPARLRRSFIGSLPLSSLLLPPSSGSAAVAR